MQARRWTVGDVTIVQIVEVDASPALVGLIDGLDPTAAAAADWLVPDFADRGGRLRGLVQAFVLLTASATIVVDPGVGSAKRRSAVPAWDHLESPVLSRMRAEGVDPADVDFVINTHLHFDHVGGNTELVDGHWAPAYPRARYVIPALEFAYWQTNPRAEIADQHAGFADSVLPVVAAGQVDLVADDHRVSAGVRLVPMPGHTPHQVGVLLEADGGSALFTGDLMHHPCQIAYPAWGSVSDFDPEQARASRRAILGRYVDTDTLVFGAHFADPVAGRIKQGDGRYSFAVMR